MKQKARFGIFDLIKKFDTFGRPIPSFNLDGKNVFRTTLGAVVSIIIFSTTSAFAAMKY